MNDKVFIDSNIIVYSYSNSEITKQTIARKIITEKDSIISTQVLQELCNIVTKKFKYTYSQAENILKESCQNNKLYTNSKGTIIKACQLADLYRFSFYDSLIVAAALESGCSLLYSEDLQNGQIIDNTLTIRNPFLNVV